MAYVKTTWIDDVTPLGAANLNKIEQGIADAHGGVRKAPSCRLSSSAAWSVADDGGFHDLTGGWNVEAWDNDAMHDPVTNPDRITFQTAGIYIVALALNMAGGAGERFARLGGSLAAMGAGSFEIDRVQQPAFANDVVVLRLVTPVQAAVNDFVYVQAGSYQKGSACAVSLNTAPNGYGEPMFAAWKVGDIA